jgi:hypothetical protein
VADNLVQSVRQNICERRGLETSEILCELPQISRMLLLEIISYAGLSQVIHKTGYENAHGCAQNAEYGFDCFRAIPQSWR